VATSSKAALAAGSAVRGKWNKRIYRIERLLGEGANGKVYLVSEGSRLFALKFGFDALNIQSEINALKAMDSRIRANGGTPFLDDADDADWNGAVFPFYVMRYVNGLSPAAYLNRYGKASFYRIGYTLLLQLHRLHRIGFVFGDLKTENVLVSEEAKAELIDYGGLTEKGKSIKQFSEWYDRSYWNAGSRAADEGYDLFSFSVFCLILAGSANRIRELAVKPSKNRSPQQLAEIAKSNPLCRPISGVLEKALLGRFAASAEALAEWRERQPLGQQDARVGAWIPAVFFGSLGLLAVSLLL
jgi:serine/threonine-protein kinase